MIQSQLPVTQRLKLVCEKHGVGIRPRETLADLFDLDDRASTDLIWRELTDQARRLDEMNRRLEAIQAAIPIKRPRKQPAKV